MPVATAASSMEQQHCRHRSAAEQEPILQLSGQIESKQKENTVFVLIYTICRRIYSKVDERMLNEMESISWQSKVTIYVKGLFD